jgi:predicted NBD/HSP70 family sugar kinase
MASAISAFSNRDVRLANARSILSHMWMVEAQTGSDLMRATGLTRATVHDVCQELLDRGWIEELPNQRVHGDYVKGRPARRYAFSARAGVVVGVDAGGHRVIATVADLRGQVISQCTRECGAEADEATGAAQRLQTVSSTVLEALAAEEISSEMVLAVGVGVPAPVGTDGQPVTRTKPFWTRINPNIGAHLSTTQGWTALVDNDANLAALAERWVGRGQGKRHFITLLAGERLGAGVVDQGRLFRGSSGRGGEMNWLDFVDGVGSADGIAMLSRQWAFEELSSGTSLQSTILRNLSASEITPQQVFAAARDGDPLAGAVIKRLGHRFARVSAVLAEVFDTDLIIVAGGVASAIEPILEVIRQELPDLVDPPVPQVVASTLGHAVVSTGAIRRAIDHVQDHALEISLPKHPGRESPPGGPEGTRSSA